MPRRIKLLPSPFYRVTSRAVIRDDRGRLLVLENSDHEYELPGGGWEHSEAFDEGLKREIREELGVDATTIGQPWFAYRCETSRGWWTLRLAVPVTLKSHNFRPDDGMLAARFVGKDEFMQLPWTDEEWTIKDHADKLWPPVEKKAENR